MFPAVWACDLAIRIKEFHFISLINIFSLTILTSFFFLFFSENKEIAIKLRIYKICRNGDDDICMNSEVPAKWVSLGARGKGCVGHSGVLVWVVPGAVG